MVLHQQFFVHPRLVIKTLEITFATKLEQVIVANLVFGQKKDMVGILISGSAGMALDRSNVKFTANDWLYVRFLGLKVELNDPIQGTMVSDGQAFHPKLFGPLNQLGDTAQAVKQTVFGVNMQMSKHLCQSFQICEFI